MSWDERDDEPFPVERAEYSDLDQRPLPLARWEWTPDDSQRTRWLKSVFVQNCYVGIWGLFFTLSWAAAVWVVSILINR
jgi:hypothetical protein